MSGTIYVDLRCLQDLAYRWRGIGYHTAALLRSRKASSLSKWKIVGLTDSRMPSLCSEFESLVDETTISLNPCTTNETGIFIDGSPMTHDSRFGLRFQNLRGVIRAAVLYDFIPLDWPGYLVTVANRMEYMARLARLKSFEVFYPISGYTAERLAELVGVSRERIKVTGASVRRSLYEIQQRPAKPPLVLDQNSPYFVTLGGDDKRKNTEVAVKAVQRLNVLYGRCVALKVIGHYGESYKADLRRIAGNDDRADFLQFYSYIPDEQVVSLHAGAIAAIAPSHIEGFSLPVAEAAVCGCPVIVSTCAAHMELVQRTEACFRSDDYVELAEKLDALLREPSLGASLVKSQAHLAPNFHEEAVGSRFWHSLEDVVAKRPTGTVVVEGRKPRLAFLCPADSSDGVNYASMIREAERNPFDADVFADSPHHANGSRHEPTAGISTAPFVSGRYDGIISVLGNSSSYKHVLALFERYGGPCILHDVRLTHLYFEHLGQPGFFGFAEDLLGSKVPKEPHTWLMEPDPPSLCVVPVIRRATPLMVQTEVQRSILQKRYGVDAHVLTCCPNLFFENEELAERSRNQVRKLLGISSDSFLVTSFGEVSRANGMDTSVAAVELLRSWKIPVELCFAGDLRSNKLDVRGVAEFYGMAEHVRYRDEFDIEKSYRNLLIASDAGVHLPGYGFGRAPMPLMNCLSAGLPTVASSDAATACGAPEYLSAVPDCFSPLQVAEQLALIWEARASRESHARVAFLETHNLESYARRILEVLDLP